MPLYGTVVSNNEVRMSYLDLQQFLFRKHLEEGETIQFVAHRHWGVILPKFVRNIVFFFLFPWVVWAIFPPFFWISVLWTVVGIGMMSHDILDWYLDAWLATSQSVIDVEWKGFFQYTSSRIEYLSIEGVSYAVAGFWGTVLGFGNTQIDKASQTNPIILPDASKPKKVEFKILECKSQYENKRNKVDSDGLKNIISEMVAHHVRKEGWPKTKDLKKIKL